MAEFLWIIHRKIIYGNNDLSNLKLKSRAIFVRLFSFKKIKIELIYSFTDKINIIF